MQLRANLSRKIPSANLQHNDRRVGAFGPEKGLRGAVALTLLSYLNLPVRTWPRSCRVGASSVRQY